MGHLLWQDCRLQGLPTPWAGHGARAGHHGGGDVPGLRSKESPILAFAKPGVLDDEEWFAPRYRGLDYARNFEYKSWKYEERL